MSDTYDEQIEALLAGNYKEFAGLVDWDKKERLNAPKSHYSAWCWTVDYPKSLFSTLPHSCFCASEIESGPGQKSRWRARLLKDSETYLQGPSGRDFAYTEEELNEFARRQRVARAST